MWSDSIVDHGEIAIVLFQIWTGNRRTKSFVQTNSPSTHITVTDKNNAFMGK